MGSQRLYDFDFAQRNLLPRFSDEVQFIHRRSGDRLANAAGPHDVDAIDSSAVGQTASHAYRCLRGEYWRCARTPARQRELGIAARLAGG